MRGWLVVPFLKEGILDGIKEVGLITTKCMFPSAFDYRCDMTHCSKSPPPLLFALGHYNQDLCVKISPFLRKLRLLRVIYHSNRRNARDLWWHASHKICHLKGFKFMIHWYNVHLDFAAAAHISFLKFSILFFNCSLNIYSPN